jgi:hypothetical protein
VVVASVRHTVSLEEEARAREAALCAAHAAEVARLAGALRRQKEASAVEIERLRAEHAAELRRLVEAHWRALDAAKTGVERFGTPDRVPPPVRPPRTP